MSDASKGLTRLRRRSCFECTVQASPAEKGQPALNLSQQNRHGSGMKVSVRGFMGILMHTYSLFCCTGVAGGSQWREAYATGDSCARSLPFVLQFLSLLINSERVTAWAGVRN